MVIMAYLQKSKKFHEPMKISVFFFFSERVLSAQNLFSFFFFLNNLLKSTATKLPAGMQSKYKAYTEA